VTLLIMSYIKSETAFVSQHPGKFITECVLSGLSVALPVFVILYNRGASFMNMLSPAFTIFLLFYMYNVLLEMSGTNEQTTETRIKDISTILLVVGGGLLLLFSLIVHDFSPSFLMIFMESIFMALLAAGVKVIKSRNRGLSSKFKKFGLIFGIFFFGNMIVQFGGGYSALAGN